MIATASLRSWLEEGQFTLALSSGFFGFFSHCGFATALYEEGFVPRKITGASAGALVGGALASGMSPQAVRDALFSLEQAHFWDPGFGLGYLRGKKFESVVSSYFVSTFKETVLPFEAVVLDIFRFKTTTIKDGSLPAAVVASCAVPLLFHPVKIGRKLFWDGGVFHKSAICPESSDERILCHYLHNDGLSGAYEAKQDFSRIGPRQRVFSRKGLPKVSYNSLEPGKRAFEIAYQKTKLALDRPFPGSVLHD